MALHDEQFELGVVTFAITTIAGECHIEDWNPKDADAALDYARDTAQCSDVVSVVFTDNQNGRTETYKNLAAVPA